MTPLAQEGHAFGGRRPAICRGVGKKTNCQTLVSLTLARGEVPIPVGLRLFLPDTWINDPERLQHAGVPEAFWVAPLEAGDRPG